MSVPALYPDQLVWVKGISDAFCTSRSVLGVAITGFGKTVSFVDMAKRASARGKRVLIVAHRIEIVRQIGLALARAGVPFGWVYAGMKPDPDQMVQVGMILTAVSRHEKMRAPDVIIVDEAHHATASSYRKLLAFWPRAFVLGVTATPQRTDGTGLGDIFGAMVVGPDMRELIARGRLSNFRYLAPPQRVDLANVEVRAGDYASEQLAAAMDQAAVTGDAIAHYARYLNGRPAIAFCASVVHAEHVAAEFRAAGWRAESVDGGTDELVRSDRIAAIGDGRLNVLTSCDIISEGTDIPAVAGALLLRPTKSLIIYLQQIGRVLRLKPDGSDAVILDHVGNVFQHGMPDEPRQWTLKGTKGQRQAVPEVRQCPKCFACHAPAPRCPQCQHVYEAAKPRRVAPERVDGELGDVTADQIKARRAAELKAQIAAAWRQPTDAEARAALQVIARERGYKPGFVWQQMQLRAQIRGRRAA
jgi:superfamily II DNA or RNA helicase